VTLTIHGYCDEIVIQVLKEADKSSGPKSYMWVLGSHATQEKAVCFFYTTEGESHPDEFTSRADETGEVVLSRSTTSTAGVSKEVIRGRINFVG
jgi:hypothetical protein